MGEVREIVSVSTTTWTPRLASNSSDRPAVGAEHKGSREVALNEGEAFFDVIAKSFEEEGVAGHCRRDAGSAAAQKRTIENF